MYMVGANTYGYFWSIIIKSDRKNHEKIILSLSLFRYLNFGHTKQRFGNIPFGTLLTVIKLFPLSFVVIT